MPGDKVDRRRLGPTAALAAKPLDEVFKGHVALALDQQLHRIANRTATAVDLDDAVRPIRELVRRTELWRVHLPIQIRERTENNSGALPLLSDRSHIRPMFTAIAVRMPAGSARTT